MIGAALAVAAVTLAAGLALAVIARRLPTLRWRLIALALGAAVVPLAAVLLSGVIMFDSEHDLTVLAVASASTLGAMAGAVLVARSVLVPVRRVRDASEALARGELQARAPEDGPAEVAELGTAFNHMADELERLFDARRHLVAHASHDLRTPLASLQAMLEAIEDGLRPADAYLPAMHDQVRHLSRLIDDLFELSRIDAGVLTLEMREVAVGELVQGCVRGVEASARARGVTVESRVAAGVPRIRCAPDHVERVLLNLLTNALRHTPSDGAVAVLVASEDDAVRISVEDTGEGIAPEALDRAFDRFWRADSARRRDGAGAGLGLAIARGLVEAHGGRIWAEERPGGGARVSLTLPATIAEAYEPA